MSNNRECAEYFRCHPAYNRCFQELWKKWRSYGRVAGKITLKNASEEERKAISGITGKIFDEETIRFSFAEFEAGLQNTRYAPVDMKVLLEAYFGKPLQTNQTERNENQRQKELFLKKIRSDFSEKSGNDSTAVRWLDAVMKFKKYGFQIMMREYGENPQQAEMLVKGVGKALLKLEEMKITETEIPLAVFSAEVTGNPHEFDRGSVEGTLLVHGISYCEGVSLPENAHSWRELLQSVGIIPDRISSIVHAYGLHLQTKDGWHPAYEAFCRRKESCVITMENMDGVINVKVPGKVVYVVENEMVFSYLIHQLQDQDCAVLCTSGQLRSVAYFLISMIMIQKNETEIYYSGDLDPDGIQIAERLWKKFGDRIHMWRMSPEDYQKSRSGEKIGDIGFRKLDHICHPQLKRTAKLVKESGFAGYQENILQELLEDIRKKR